jgi:predicted enzyme related to lactoylglutathione lyase
MAVVIETFFSVGVLDMKRATRFYEEALGASVTFASEGWTSLRIAEVRLGLALAPLHEGATTGLHFAVGALAAAVDDVVRAGGKVVRASVEVAPGVLVGDVVDTEGNGFTLAQR